MIYYKVKPEFDNQYLIRLNANGKQEIVGFLIKNELYTQREAKKYCGLISCCERVEIPKSKIYFFFGARFADN